MFGLGTLINAAGIVLGGLIGLLVGRRLKKNIQDILVSALGLCTLFIGLTGTLSKMFSVGENGAIEVGGTMVLLASLAPGGFLGEILGIEKRTEQLGAYLRRKSNSTGDNRFVMAFVTATMTVCIGAMAIMGAIEDAVYGDLSLLITKTILDTMFIMIMTAALGKGCIFSAIPVLLWQGLWTLIGYFAGPLLTRAALNNLSMVGSVLIFCVGWNLLLPAKIKVANLLPSIFIAVLCAYLGLT